MKHERIFLLTDGCMWEKNKLDHTLHPHAIEVVDMETGAVRYIRSGSRIAFIDGAITQTRSQETYNEQTEGKKMPADRKKHVQPRAGKAKEIGDKEKISGD